MIHKVVIDDDTGYIRQKVAVAGYHLEPPLPDDPFSYVLTEYDYDGKEVTTGRPFVAESTAELIVPLETVVFSRAVNRDSLLHSSSRQTPKPTKKIRITARILALRFGGGLFLYGGLLGQRDPSYLPLKVLEWEIKLEYGRIWYASGQNAYQKTVKCEIDSAPTAYDVCSAEGKQWPREPYLGTSFERFFFQRWLKDRSLTPEDTRPLYEIEVLAPHQQAVAQYQAELADCESYYSQWLEQNGVILTKVEDIWEYLREEALPVAAQQVKEKAQRILKEAGHPELLPQNAP